ncbi:MAG: glutamyl-tRNA reductase [Bdellovibrionota bacterium]
MSRDIESLICLSLSSKSNFSASEREQASVPADPQLRASIFKNWLDDFRILAGEDASLVYLSTCHRIEFYTYGVPEQELIGRWTELCGQNILKAERRSGLEAYEHLIRVTSSLASEVLGETQITGQIRKAFEEAKHQGWLKGPLQRTFDEALRVTKRVRAETKIGTGTVSVAHVAVDGVQDVFDGLQDKPVLVVGAGSMAEQALQRLMNIGVGRITWINRSQDRLLKHPLAGYCQILDYSEISRLAWENAVIVLATSSESPILRLEDVKSAKKRRMEPWSGPRIVLDLGLPRNAEERLHGFEDFWVRNVDEFRDIVDLGSRQRRESLKLAEKIVSEERAAFARLWNHWEQGLLIGELFNASKQLIDEELAQLSVEERPKIEYVVRNVYAKMMHQLLSHLRSLGEAESRQALEILNLAWGQSETSWQKQSQELDLKLQSLLKNPLLKRLKENQH